MAKIDLEKFICSFIERTQNLHLITEIQDVLKDQGFEYKDGQIVETEYHCTGIGTPKEEEGVLKELLPTTEEEIPHKPKFKAGDWVVSKDGKVWQITGLNKNYYQVVGINSTNSYFTIENQDQMHLWTIQDAKNGDVLAYSDSRHTWICIFKEIKNDRICDYCSYNENGDEIGFYPRSNWNYGKVLKYSPATQEQRKLFFEKMAKAGYKWDAEKKELRKIQKPDHGNTNGTNSIKFEAEPEEQLTEFEKQFLEYMFHPNTAPTIMRACCQKLLSLARKQIVEEVDVEGMVEIYRKTPEEGSGFEFPVACMVRAYRQSILDTLKKIKEL